jgi:PST family polysaccharide transporter
LAVSIGVFFFAAPLAKLIWGKNYLMSVPIIRLLAFIPFISAMNNMLGIQTMLSFGMDKLFSRIVLLAAVLDVALIVPLVSMFGARGAALTVVLTELYIMVSFGMSLRKRGFHFLGKAKSGL